MLLAGAYQATDAYRLVFSHFSKILDSAVDDCLDVWQGVVKRMAGDIEADGFFLKGEFFFADNQVRSYKL